MDLNTAVSGRRAVREYTDAHVDKASITALIDAAIQAPSAVNQQPWVFTVVRNPALLAQISQRAKAYMLEHLSNVADSERLRGHLEDPSFDIFYRAPVLILISASPSGVWDVEDCALAAQNLMLRAYGLGLGTCWIGFAQGFLNSTEGKRLVGLDPAAVAVAPIIVGHPKRPGEPIIRRPPTVHWVD